MSEELKACPCCNEDELVIYQGTKAIGTPNTLYWYKIVCMKCFFQTGERSENLTDVKKLLAEDWNTRPIEDALNKRIKDAEQHELRLTQQAQQMNKRIKELEAWQKEAVPYLKNRLSFCDKYEKIEIRKLIEQAEEHGK